MVHHPFFRFAGFADPHRHPSYMSEDAIVSDDIRLESPDLPSQSYRTDDVENPSHEAEILTQCPSCPFGDLGSSYLSFIAHIVQDILGVIDIRLYSSDLIPEIRYDQYLFLFAEMIGDI
jgi:hypothetical protein